MLSKESNPAIIQYTTLTSPEILQMPKTQVWNSWRQTCLSIAQGCQSFFVVPWYDQTRNHQQMMDLLRGWAWVSQELERMIGLFLPNVFGMWSAKVEEMVFFSLCMYCFCWEFISISACTANKKQQYLSVSCVTWMNCGEDAMRNENHVEHFGNRCHGWCGFSSFDASCHGNVSDSAWIFLGYFLDYSKWIPAWCMQLLLVWPKFPYHAGTIDMILGGDPWPHSSSSKLFSSSSPGVMMQWPSLYMQF